MRAEFRSGRSTSEPRGEAMEIALVNNMPDQALAATKAQFERLVRAGAGELTFRLRFYALYLDAAKRDGAALSRADA